MIVGSVEVPNKFRFFLLTDKHVDPKDVYNVKVSVKKQFTVEDYSVNVYTVCTDGGCVNIPNIFNIIINDDGKTKLVTPSELKKMIDGGMSLQTSKGFQITKVEESGSTNEFLLYDVVENPNKFREFLLIFDYDVIEVKPLTLDSFVSMIIGEEIANVITDILPGILELEFEKVYDFILLVAKKKYAAWKTNLKFDVKGLEYVRGEWPQTAKDLQKDIISILAQYETETAKKVAIKHIRSEIKKYLRREFNIDDVIIKKRVKNREEYKNPDTQPQFRARRILEEHGFFIPSGFFVEYVVLKVPSKVFEKIKNGYKVLKNYDTKKLSVSDRVYPVEVVNDVDLLKEYIDIEYVLNNQILPPTLRVTSIVGINDSIFMDHKNSKLDDYMGVGKKAIDKVNKKLSSLSL